MKKTLLALAALAAVAAGAPTAQAHGGGLALPLDPVAQPELGMVFDGLEPMAVGPCAGGYAITGADDCTHGPDPAPAGIDVRVAAPLEAVPAGTPAKVSCTGDGTSGKRVQLLYVRASDVTDRYADSKESLAVVAANVD